MCCVVSGSNVAVAIAYTSRETDTVRGSARSPHFSLAIISITVQLRIYVFWVISVYFNLRNIVPKSGTFPLGHLYIYTYIFVNVLTVIVTITTSH